MPRITEDPTRAVCPSFEGLDWDFLRQPMIDAHAGDDPLTAEEATQRMKEAWTRENDRKIAAWNVQLEQDRVEQEERDRLAQEEEEARHAQLEREAEEQRREAEKKKPKFGHFDPHRPVNESIEPRPAPYALTKLGNLEYIELDYFTARGCREAIADTTKSISHDTLAFTQLEDTISIQPLAAIRPSKRIRNDEDLTWEEMLGAKNTMLRFIAKSGTWPATHAESMAAFYVNLELHPRVLLPNGKQTLLLYQARVRREWYDAFKREEGFNIELLQDNLLSFMAEEINGLVVAKEIEQVQCPPCSPLLYQSLTRSSFSPPAPLYFALPSPAFSQPADLLCATCHHPPFAICHAYLLSPPANPAACVPAIRLPVASLITHTN
jgi:hypothetical protein